MVRRKIFKLGYSVCLIIAFSVSVVSTQLAQADGDNGLDISLDDIRSQLSANIKETKTGDSAEAITVNANRAAAKSKITKATENSDFDAETKRLEAEEEKVLARMQPAAQKSISKEPFTSESSPLSDIPEVKKVPEKVIKENLDAEAPQLGKITKTSKPSPGSNNTQAISVLRSENEDLKHRIEENETKSTTLLAQLEEARNRLIIAETEVERLSSVLEARNSAAVSGNPRSDGGRQVQSSGARQPSTEADDMPIATVTADKAQLRAGPSMSDSPLMAITKGTRLAVETRRGDWLRVISPAGSRAWVNLDVVSFGSTSGNSARNATNLGSSR